MNKDLFEIEKSESIHERKTETTESISGKETSIRSDDETEEEKFSYSYKKLRVGSINEAPDFLKDNEYIKQGYRINFNSTKKVLRSLFMLHNESVNIWTHLIGAIIIILLILYTFCFIRAYKNDLMKINLHLNITEINDDIKHVTKNILDFIPAITDELNKKYEKSLDAVHNITASIINKTSEYIHIIDEKIGIYNSYVNCVHCYEEFVENVRNLKNKIGEYLGLYKDKILNESKHIMETVEDASVIHFMDDLNTRIINLKNKYSEIFNQNPLDWVDNYGNQHDPFSNLVRWPLFVMLVSAIICLGFSTIFHWLSAHSKNWHDLLNRLDYAGISILIAGSCYPPYYYFFYCKQILAIIYLSFISIFAIFVFVYSIKPDFNTPLQRKLRGTLFLVLGLSCGIPILHLAIFPQTIENFKAPLPLVYWYAGGISYVTGALIYIMRFPEKWRPGKHDIWGSSHQIFHCFVLLGVAFHYFGSLDSYYYRAQYRCEIS